MIIIKTNVNYLHMLALTCYFSVVLKALKHLITLKNVYVYYDAKHFGNDGRCHFRLKQKELRLKSYNV